jgi:hypothetical protein
LNSAFQSACEQLGVLGSPADRNRALLNRRKSGDLSIETTKRTEFDDDPYRFASEIAIRILERRDQKTLDDVLCDPERVLEFDELATSIVPGYRPLQYRWAALALRKSRNLAPEVVTRLLRPEEAHLVRFVELDVDSLPRQPGVYSFIDASSRTVLYIGEASSLRVRLSTHLDHSDNKYLARHLWDNDTEQILVEYYVLPNGTSKRELRAIENEHILRRQPLFNIAGRVTEVLE